MIESWHIYQRERFPLALYAILSAVFAWSALTSSALLRGTRVFTDPFIWLAAAASALLIFAQMRALDEIKDYADDAQFRPYRPIPRGLVTLGDMRRIVAAAAAIEFVIALTVDARLLWLLACVWAYLALMTAEFFVPRWLKSHPFAYLASHVPLAGIIALYLTGFEWLVANARPSPALVYFCMASVMATALLEIGRKIRAPHDEEPGVVTYSAVWGCRISVAAWLAALALMLASGSFAAHAAGFAPLFFMVLQLPVAALACAFALRFLGSHSTHRARQIEVVSGGSVLALYMGLGPIPAFTAM